ncbi:hypothetical protein C7Y66_25510 [Chroococcidiopsis sp. CCALA 051]|nr:hypothetical protein C7Y66_25510 [Chroococcidiopsis sp. CCALA 051]
MSDRNLLALEAKFWFLLVVYAIKYVVAWEMVKWFYSCSPGLGAGFFGFAIALMYRINKSKNSKLSEII